MRQTYLILLSCIVFCACGSTRDMRMELLKMRSNLFYEMTTPEYYGKKGKTLYLDFIDYSNLAYYSDVKRDGWYFIPAIVYFEEVVKYKTSLGEGSLNQTYREFLTEALLAECNSSRTFSLIDNKEETAPDSVYHLSVKVLQNETTGKMKIKTKSLLWFDGEVIEGNANTSGEGNTNLSILIKIKKNGECLFEKTYTNIYNQYASAKTHYDTFGVNEDCLNTMTASLSNATKALVENISQELDLVLDSFKQ